MKVDKVVAAKVVSEPVGIARGLDILNRIVIPKEYMRRLEKQLNNKRELEMLMFDDSTIILQPVKNKEGR